MSTNKTIQRKRRTRTNDREDISAVTRSKGRTTTRRKTHRRRLRTQWRPLQKCHKRWRLHRAVNCLCCLGGHTLLRIFPLRGGWGGYTPILLIFLATNFSIKEQVRLPKPMNFRKKSKWPFTQPPPPPFCNFFPFSYIFSPFWSIL